MSTDERRALQFALYTALGSCAGIAGTWLILSLTAHVRLAPFLVVALVGQSIAPAWARERYRATPAEFDMADVFRLVGLSAVGCLLAGLVCQALWPGAFPQEALLAVLVLAAASSGVQLMVVRRHLLKGDRLPAERRRDDANAG